MGKWGLIVFLALAMFLGTHAAAHAGTITPWVVLCPAGEANNDAKVVAEDCNPRAPRQMWSYSATTHEIRRVTNTSASLCMDVAGKVIVPKARVIVYACNGQHNQQWEFRANEIRVRGGDYCLTLPHADEGEQFEIYLCDNNRWGALQNWKYTN